MDITNEYFNKDRLVEDKVGETINEHDGDEDDDRDLIDMPF